MGPKPQDDHKHYLGIEILIGQILYLFMLLVIVLIHHYLVQRDLAIETVEKTMIKRQQTYMKHFLIDNKDAMVLLDENCKVKLHNEMALKLFAQEDEIPV